MSKYKNGFQATASEIVVRKMLANSVSVNWAIINSDNSYVLSQVIATRLKIGNP